MQVVATHKTPDTVNIDGVNITDTLDICNAFNEYFANIGKQNIGNPSIQLPSSTCTTVYLDPVTECKIYNIGRKMTNSKSTSYDTIGFEMLQQDIHFYNSFTELYCQPLFSYWQKKISTSEVVLVNVLSPLV